ncbi:MAG: hypothetical protein JXR76_00345 [Deltaproteobacteria bacterium]|nr:hypothetical protein [Deltaproteobacteria bacterium]
MPSLARSQGVDAEAIALKKKAMAAYGNLDLDGAMSKLDEAAAMGAELAPNTVAQIYIGYGVVFVGGHGDNARGQDAFTIARCLDASVSIDPLFSSPEVDMIFKMAQARANQQVCPGLLSNVAYMGNSATGLPSAGPTGGESSIDDLLAAQQQAQQPLPPVQSGMLPPCGNHNSPAQQRKSTELPLMIQIEPAKLATLDRIVLKYAYDGGGTYFEMDMTKGDQGWVTAMLTCDEGQITAFDPGEVTYYIVGYDDLGGQVCGQGSQEQPFTVIMDPGASIVTGLAGMPTPQTCSECPPWDQDCHNGGGSAGSQTPCFSDEECLQGQWCSDAGFCEGDSTGGDGDDGFGMGADSPQKFYIQVMGGTGVGYANTPEAWYIRATYNGGVYDPDEFFAYMIDDGIKRGGWGGVPIRAHVGIVFSSKFSLEIGGRLDISAAWRKQTDVLYCAYANPNENGAINEREQAICDAPRADEPLAFGAWRDAPDPSDENSLPGAVRTTTRSGMKNAWLVNARLKTRFINKGGNQVSFFGGLGYGHLFFAPEVSDVDVDGKKDKVVATPGMINIELGLGYAHYLNKKFGFVVEMPVDIVLGENSSFGLGVDLMLGISFGG